MIGELGKTIKILALTYQIEEVDVISKDEHLLGEINYIKQVIRIDKELSEEHKEVVLLHEILHGICNQLGLDEINKNESSIQGLATALYQTLSSSTIFSWRT